MHFSTLHRESGKRDSNPRPQPWQGCALPTELFPQTLLPFRTATTPHLLRTKRVRTAAAVLGRIHGDGGEGNRTPDLVNAIHALSQLSYAPRRRPRAVRENVYRPEPPSIATCISRVNEMGLAKTSAASILQRLLGSSPISERHRRSLAIARLLTVEMRRK